jgi:hypothetical protein
MVVRKGTDQSRFTRFNVTQPVVTLVLQCRISSKFGLEVPNCMTILYTLQHRNRHDKSGDVALRKFGREHPS